MREDAKVSKADQNVGQMLKSRRQALKLSLAQVEMTTKIRGKFLLALEAGDYDSLPNDIYSRGFVQHYANHLGLDGAFVAAQYAGERGGIQAAETKSPQLERPARLVFTGKMLAALGVLMTIALVVGYLLWQFSALAAAPSLTVSSPDSDLALTGSSIEVSGRTTPGADITVNDSPVLTDTNGYFSERVALQDGVNAIHVSATSKLGKVTSVTRNVLAKLPKVDPATAVVPSAVFDGVAVAVSVKETTSVVVVVDGGAPWRATVMAGWSQVFTGKKDINITTGNAGATSVIVTNSLSAEKVFDTLGAAGEIRRNQVFAKDTVFAP